MLWCLQSDQEAFLQSQFILVSIKVSEQSFTNEVFKFSSCTSWCHIVQVKILINWDNTWSSDIMRPHHGWGEGEKISYFICLLYRKMPSFFNMLVCENIVTSVIMGVILPVMWYLRWQSVRIRISQWIQISKSKLVNPHSNVKIHIPKFYPCEAEFCKRAELYYLIKFFRSVSTLFSHFNSFKV